MTAINCEVSFDRVEIKMVGEKAIIIERPKSVPIEQWNRFWKKERAWTPTAQPLFTQEDLEANNCRRLASIPR